MAGTHVPRRKKRQLTAGNWRSGTPDSRGYLSSLNRKRRTTTTGGSSIGVVNNKARAFQPFAIVNFGSSQILIAHGIHYQLDSLAGYHGIVFGQILVKSKTILKARTAATGNKYPQHQTLVTFLINQAFNLVCRRSSELHCRRLK